MKVTTKFFIYIKEVSCVVSKFIRLETIPLPIHDTPVYFGSESSEPAICA